MLTTKPIERHNKYALTVKSRQWYFFVNDDSTYLSINFCFIKSPYMLTILLLLY